MKKKIIVFVFFGIVFISAFGSWLFFTTRGAQFIVGHFFEHYGDMQHADYKDITGNLAEGIFLENIELNHLYGFPEGTRLRIQSFFLQVSSFNVLQSTTLTIDNARLFLPESETIFISGFLKKGILDFNFYSSGFSLDELSDYFPDIKRLGFSGFIEKSDISLKGNIREPEIQGSFLIQRMSYQNISLIECPVEIDLGFENLFMAPKPFGNLKTQGGQIRAFRSVVSIEDGKIVFSGDFENPGFQFLGHSTVDGVRIRISLRGTRDNPLLRLSSSPSLSQEHLMIMLATGRRWKGVEDSLSRGEIPDNITKEFVDYFLFSKESLILANYFGISEFNITYEKDKKGLEVKKDLFDRWRVGYGFLQQEPEGQPGSIVQKILGEYEILDGGFVGVERKIKDPRQETSSGEALNEQTQTENRIFFRYRKDF